MGGGSILAGLILRNISAFIIDRDFKKGAAFAVAGAILTFFGFMHGQEIGVNQTPGVAITYILAARRSCCSPAPISPGVSVRELEHERADEEEVDVSQLEGEHAA